MKVKSIYQIQVGDLIEMSAGYYDFRGYTGSVPLVFDFHGGWGTVLRISEYRLLVLTPIGNVRDITHNL